VWAEDAFAYGQRALSIEGGTSSGRDFVTGRDDYSFLGFAQDGWSFSRSRQLAGDVTGDGQGDVATVHRSGTDGIRVWVHPAGWYEYEPDRWSAALAEPEGWADLRTAGWSWANSRQYLADTNGDYVLDLVTVHRSGTGGLVVWRHLSDGTRFAAPQRVADLSGRNGWSWLNSREGVADTWGYFVD
jgi:hypothetical protein